MRLPMPITALTQYFGGKRTLAPRSCGGPVP